MLLEFYFVTLVIVKRHLLSHLIIFLDNEYFYWGMCIIDNDIYQIYRNGEVRFRSAIQTTIGYDSVRLVDSIRIWTVTAEDINREISSPRYSRNDLIVTI